MISVDPQEQVSPRGIVRIDRAVVIRIELRKRFEAVQSDTAGGEGGVIAEQFRARIDPSVAVPVEFVPNRVEIVLHVAVEPAERSHPRAGPAALELARTF